ncbi:hypothetical protein EV702DRAFT_405476 [Suillus placidus]|uniref:Uncharacterized protein n=1 Tax=Suillus placidus TaxID=48579 RepID=A0A9P6ZTB0_9AGAM|nr:hypothetical protein EV702DRAFT_405476 [Suillus placidus]
MFVALNWMNGIITAILGVIMIARLHAMYQRSGKVLIFLTIVFLAVDITDGVIAAITTRYISGGTYLCHVDVGGDVLLWSTIWVLITVWEVLALGIAVWITVKHFRELQRHSAGGIIGDCFAVLIKTHVAYFTGFVVVSCFTLGYLSPTLSVHELSMGTQIYLGIRRIFLVMQMFVLGPRLVLNVRESRAGLQADPHAGTDMTSIAFQERVHVSSASSVYTQCD